MTREEAKRRLLGADWRVHDYVPIHIGNMIDGLVNLGLLQLDTNASTPTPAAVTRAILWTNGQVMAFDSRGRQVPAYQGNGKDIIPKLRKDFPDLVIEGMDWHSDKGAEQFG
jgi:hypothetical protein